MLYIATVHYQSPRWIEIQHDFLNRHIDIPYQTWTSLEGIDPSYASYFDRVLEQANCSHPAKLNHLALEISQESADTDLLMFLDGDAFPIANPMPLIDEGLTATPLVAVRRAENVDEPQPHPLFCVTTVQTWRTLGGDWTPGYMWPSAQGGYTTDAGGNLLRRLELSRTPWTEVLRSNRHNIDPVFFAIYGEVIYHHGGGFHTGVFSPAHHDLAPAPLSGSANRMIGPPLRFVNRARLRAWERRTRMRLLRESERVYGRIEAGGMDWLDEFV